jgi:ferredoxin-NADP reductase
VATVGGHTARLAEMKPGTPVWAEGPFGTFTAQRRTRRRALLIAGGSGIAPIRALLEDMPPDTIVIYRAGRPDELVFAAVVDAELLAVHGAVHDALAGRVRSPLAAYLPGTWLPHCVLATERPADAFALLHPVPTVRARVVAVDVQS